MTFTPNYTVYLINAYSCYIEDKDKARLIMAQRRDLEAYIGGAIKKKYGHTIILPIALNGRMSDICHFDTGFSTWERDDFTLISKCDAVWVLLSEGWRESVGVQAEIKFALEQGITIQ